MLPEIQPEDVFDSYQQDELDIAYKKCEKLVRSSYLIGETLYRIRNKNSEEAITEITKFKTDNLGFSDSSYQIAMSHGQTAARF